ncbi:MAG: hypothetical protein B7O98_08955 [Zestosphaera tikiterensis]|uniref:Methyltransferase FkbM domain-containing protein n=1 Tax=Zestosphaera tikiterensis TaxID=1973259 RepID=A0A2R7Y2N5_9CREN|nr:MAG: hypothetical protein B7O98_08955 [Zestosphaera tikiterensis]
MLKEVILKAFYRPLAWMFYKRAKYAHPPPEMSVDFKALDIPSKFPIALKLCPLDEGFSREFSLYGFREALNTLLVYWVVKRLKPCVIDVGANLGYYVGIELAAGAPKIIAIEPSPITFRYLKENFGKDPSIHFLQAAVSDTEDEAVLQISRALNLSSIVNLEDLKHTKLAIKVKTYTLQSIVENFKLHECRDLMVRMDVEGYEYKILSHIPPEVTLINVEIHLNRYDVIDFVKRVLGQGFRVKYFVSDPPFGFYVMIKHLGLIRSLKILNKLGFATIKEYPDLRELRYLLRNSILPYIFFERVRE